MNEGTDAAQPPAEPPLVLRVVRGEPTAEELAALIAVVAAHAAGDDASPARPRSAWNAPARLVRQHVAHGPGGWRRSSLPR